jgi:hypothetical protein
MGDIKKGAGVPVLLDPPFFKLGGGRLGEWADEFEVVMRLKEILAILRGPTAHQDA